MLAERNACGVEVQAAGGDRFRVATQQAIDALQLARQAVDFQQQFEDLLEMLSQWLRDRQDRLSSAVITIGSDGIRLVVVQLEVKADFALEEEMVDLDIDVANDDQFNLIPFSTLLVPRVGDEVLQSFMSSDQNLRHTNADC